MKFAITALRTTATLLLMLLAIHPALGEQSSITEVDGYSCMGVDKSRKETESAALQDAKRNAVEFSKTYIQSETQMENFELKKDLVEAFSRANVKVLEVLEEEWQNPAEGDCYTIRIKAEVIPKADEIRQASSEQMLDDPTAPLNVKVWTNQESFKAGDTLKIYLKGNKPFYGRLLYVNAKDTSLQILPNPYRTENYFQGGVIYEIPTATDRFDLTIQPPFGREKLVLYASTSPLGEIDKSDVGPVYQVNEDTETVAAKTRGISLTSTADTSDKPKNEISEFAETSLEVTTTQ